MRFMFIDRKSVTPIQLRDSEGKLAVSMPRTNYLKNSFSDSGALLWDSLLIGLRQAQSIDQFRVGCRDLFEL